MQWGLFCAPTTRMCRRWGSWRWQTCWSSLPPSSPSSVMSTVSSSVGSSWEWLLESTPSPSPSTFPKSLLFLLLVSLVVYSNPSFALASNLVLSWGSMLLLILPHLLVTIGGELCFFFLLFLLLYVLLFSLLFSNMTLLSNT